MWHTISFFKFMYIKRIAVFLIFAMLSCFTVSVYAQKVKQNSQQSSAQIAQEIFKLVNKHRQKVGLKPLKQNDAVAKIAESHSRNMAKGDVPFGHDGFEERAAQLKKQFKKMGGTAENVAYSTRDAQSVVEMWLNSKGHRKNIEGNYTMSGISVVQGGDGQRYYTQIFLKNP